MKQKRHKPEEIIRLLRECDGSGMSQESFAQQKQILVATLHRWRKKYGQMDEEDAKRLKASIQFVARAQRRQSRTGMERFG